MSDSTQALCFMAGANSIFTGDKLLTTENSGDDRDAALFAKLGITPMPQPPHAALPEPAVAGAACRDYNAVAG
jgi:biotin synthase